MVGDPGPSRASGKIDRRIMPDPLEEKVRTAKKELRELKALEQGCSESMVEGCTVTWNL